MQQYKDFLSHILNHGELLENRTGIKAYTVPGHFMRFDMADGFPAVTVKKLAFKSVIAELIGFLRGATSAADFRALGTKIWDQNANENEAWLGNAYRKGEDDLGVIYGSQWRKWQAWKEVPDKLYRQASEQGGWGYHSDNGHGDTMLWKEVDQIANCLRLIMTDPSNRRILFHAWNPAELDAMALAPCHLLYQFHVAGPKLHLSMYVRSNDAGLGTPFNIASGASLLHLVARITGKTPSLLNYHVGDGHIYENHLEMVKVMLNRDPLPLPTLRIEGIEPAATWEEAVKIIDTIEPSAFVLQGYEHHAPISAPMAV